MFLCQYCTTISLSCVQFRFIIGVKSWAKEEVGGLVASGRFSKVHNDGKLLGHAESIRTQQVFRIAQ